jgi:hypothetical protein
MRGEEAPPPCHTHNLGRYRGGKVTVLPRCTAIRIRVAILQLQRHLLLLRRILATDMDSRLGIAAIIAAAASEDMQAAVTVLLHLRPGQRLKLQSRLIKLHRNFISVPAPALLLQLITSRVSLQLGGICRSSRCLMTCHLESNRVLIPHVKRPMRR